MLVLRIPAETQDSAQAAAEAGLPKPSFVAPNPELQGPETQPHRNGESKLPSSKVRNLRVLVIEDEESIRRFLALGLSQLGHSAKLTANAQEGLAAFAAESFDVVLTDLGLPGASGEEVARSVARLSPNNPVIRLTGWP